MSCFVGLQLDWDLHICSIFGSLFSQIYVFLIAITFIGLFACLLATCINSNMKAFMELMEVPIGARIVPTIVLNVLPVIFGAPPPIMGPVYNLTTGWEARTRTIRWSCSSRWEV